MNGKHRQFSKDKGFAKRELVVNQPRVFLLRFSFGFCLSQDCRNGLQQLQRLFIGACKATGNVCHQSEVTLKEACLAHLNQAIVSATSWSASLFHPKW